MQISKEHGTGKKLNAEETRQSSTAANKTLPADGDRNNSDDNFKASHDETVT